MRRFTRFAYPAVAAFAVGVCIAIAPVASAAASAPATPVDLTVLGNGASTISLSWTQPATGSRVRSFRVYEGTAIVARNTTTHLTVENLAFGSRHTFTVTAVDRQGRESAHSTPVTGSAFIGGPPPPPPSCPLRFPPPGLTVTAVTASAVSLHWPPFFSPPLTFLVSGGGQASTTNLTSARVGGLAPATTYTFSVGWVSCPAATNPSVTVTTAAGPAPRPGAPTGLTVQQRTSTTIGLSWTAPAGADPAARYAVYEGGTLVATSSGTSATVGRLFHATGHRFTVAALDAAGSESTHSAPVPASTLPCEAGPPAPSELTARAVSASTVALSWVSEAAADSFTVFDGPGAVLTTRVPSAAVTGLASASTHTFRVVANLPGCGSTPAGDAPAVTTGAGPAARPVAPADLRFFPAQSPPNTGRVTLGWTPAPDVDRAVGFRLYEGATVLATTGPTTTATLQLPVATRHLVSVVAVDPAGNESPQSAPVNFVVPFIPPP